jgi:ubiquinone biosynthesis protein UbiJ
MLQALIETGSRKVLATDPNTLEKLAKLADKTIALNILKLDKTVFIRTHSDAITLGFEQPDNPEDIDVTLIAKPSTLLKIARDGIEDANLEAGELVIEGDAIVGQRFASLMNQLDIDWEELFSEIIGDVPARALFSMFEGLQKWSAESGQTMKANVSDYLLEESNLLAHPIAVDDFNDQVDTLRNDTARLEARLSKLTQLLSDNASK